MSSISEKPNLSPILVAGGAGFLGSHLCERLLALGHSVLCVDNLWTGDIENIQQFIGNPRFEFLRQDVTVPLARPVSAIYNLACPASPIHYQADPIHTTRTIVLGALNLLELARVASVPYLQASTSEVYGDPLVHPQIESDWGNVNPVGPRACYDEGKRCAESLCLDYARQYGVQVKIARIFNTYGPRMGAGDGRVVSNFICQALAGTPLTMYGSGAQTRSFCFVTDLIRGLVSLMSTEPSFTGPVNIGNPRESTLLELANIVLRLTQSDSQLVFQPLPVDDPRRRRPDIALARKALDWSPAVLLEDGILETIAWHEAKAKLNRNKEQQISLQD